MEYKVCIIRINVTSYDVTFVTKREGSNSLSSVATPLLLAVQAWVRISHLTVYDVMYSISNFNCVQVTIDIGDHCGLSLFPTSVNFQVFMLR